MFGATKTDNSQTSDILTNNYGFEGGDSLYYSGKTARLGGPRLQLPKGQSDPSTFNADFLEESEELNLEDASDTTKGIISSLMIDPSGRNPLDFIQEDFHTASSAVFSNRLLSNALDDALGARGSSYLSKTGAAASLGSSLADGALDHTTLAMQNLYVGDASNVESRGTSGAASGVSYNGLLSPPTSTESLPSITSPSPATTSTPAQGGSVATGSNRVNRGANMLQLGAGGNQGASATQGPATGSTSVNIAVATTTSSSSTGGASHGHGRHHNARHQGGGPSGANPANNPAATGSQNAAADAGMSNEHMMPPGGAFYIPHGMYLDPNGKPVYYRMAPSQYQPEVVYGGPNGAPMDPTAMHMAYMPMPAGYWPAPGAMAGHDPSSPGHGGAVYMPPGGNGSPVDANGMMRRHGHGAMPVPMVFNQAGMPMSIAAPNGTAMVQMMGPNGMVQMVPVPLSPPNNQQNTGRNNNHPGGSTNNHQQQQHPGNEFAGVYGMIHPGMIAMAPTQMRTDQNGMDQYTTREGDGREYHPGTNVVTGPHGEYMPSPEMMRHGGDPRYAMMNMNMSMGMNMNMNMNMHPGMGMVMVNGMPTPAGVKGHGGMMMSHGNGHLYDPHGHHGDDGRGNMRGDGRIRDRDRDRNNHGDRDRGSAAHHGGHHGGNNRQGGNNNTRGGTSNTNNSTANTVRDSVVEDFRNTYGKSRQWVLRDLVGHFVAFCQDQHGSRFIQQRLEVCTDAEKQLVFDEIIPAANVLMSDVFGNYVLQKLFEFGNPEQCDQLAELLTGQCVQLAMQMYGCRVVQKALEYIGTSRLISLFSEFEDAQVLLSCVHDANGNHVIQKCIEVINKAIKDTTVQETVDFLSARMQYIIDAFKDKVRDLSSHPYGCRVVQRILEHCSATQKTAILEELRQHCKELVQDCYGNYVIQFVMQHGWEADRQVLIKEVHTNLLDFSQHKFASNVVEKCLQYASKRDRDEMIWKIINVTFDPNSPIDGKGQSVLEAMVRDPYANYVVQKVIDVSDEKQRAAMLKYVRDNITQLRRYTYGKHIILRLEKITNEKF